jgi:two-component system OmpR family sensor kinase
MAKTAWYRSLYWRIGLGFVLFLAAVLVVQGGALVWLISRMEVAPGPPPPEVTRLAARDLSEALTANPQLDIQQFLREEYEGSVPLVAVMKDGRVVSSDGSQPSDQVVNQIRARLNASFAPFPRGGRSVRGRAQRPARPDIGGGQRGGGQRMEPGAPRRAGAGGVIVWNGEVAGVVVAMPRSAFRQLGPALAGVGLLLVVLGTTTAAVLIFGPVRRRLRSLEDATRQVGAGDLTARAREDGGDEVAALARAFNQMTHDLQARAAQLQAADRARRLLLADVSHELMTPLTGMRGYLETLSLRAPSIDADTRERYLSIIRDETQRVEHIVGDLLDLARLEGGGDSFDAQDVPLENLFGRVLARHERAAEQKGVAFRANVEPGAEIVTGDPMRLEQALQNLAANALRHTPRGGSVTLAASVDGDAVVVAVSDTGSGIAADHLDHIFDRFYKVDPARGGQTRGSGLGLSIVKAIVERHNGTITATSRPGEGTTFAIKFSSERPINP